MYHEHPFKASDEQLAELVKLSATLEIRPGPGGSTATDRAHTRRLYEPFLHEFLPGEWVNVMIIALWPSSQLVGHTDPPIKGVRHHIPLQINDQCWVLHGSEWRQLIPGQCYIMDPTEWHGAVNWGHALRLHLIIDILPN
jgi:hypothetical protein